MTFFQSISVLRHISIISGVFPIHKKHKLLQWITIMYLFLFSACLTSIAAQKSSSLNEIISGNYYKFNVVSSFGLLFHFVIGTVLVFTIYICSFFKTGQVNATLEAIQDVDEKLKGIGEKFQYHRDRLLTTGIYLIGCLIIAVLVPLQATNIHRENLKPMSVNIWFVMLFPLIISNLMTVQYSFTVLAIYDRLKKIHQQLKTITDFEEKQSNYVIHKINLLLQLHDTLCSVAKQTNQNYVIQLLVIFNNQYGMILFCIFYCYWMVNVYT